MKSRTSNQKRQNGRRSAPKRSGKPQPRLQRKGRKATGIRSITRGLPIGVSRVLSTKAPVAASSVRGTEPLGFLQFNSAVSSGSVIYDLLVNPTILGGSTSTLASRALSFSSYRFRKMALRVESFMPSVSMGSITFAIVRDVDYDIPQGQALLYAKNAEANRTTSAAIVRPIVVPISCDPSKNRQIWYDTTPSADSDTSQYAQFRILVVINQPPSIVGTTTGTLGMDLFLEYDIELCGPTGYASSNVSVASQVPSGTYTIAANDADEGAHITGFSPSLTGFVDNGVYLSNPALTLYTSAGATSGATVPVRSFWRKSAGKLLLYDNPQSANSTPGFGNINMANGTYLNFAQTNFYYLGASLPVKGPTLVMSEQNLSDDDKTKHAELLALFRKMGLVTSTGPSESSVDQRQNKEIAEIKAEIKRDDRQQEEFNETMRNIVKHNESMVNATRSILGAFTNLLQGDMPAAIKDSVNAAKTSAAVALDAAANALPQGN